MSEEDRKISLNAALKDGIHLKKHMGSIPEIYSNMKK